MRTNALCLLILFCAVSVASASGYLNTSRVMSITPGLDTMPPVLSRVYLGCGKYEYTATELRNIPNPPLSEPHPTDQVDRGLGSVTTVGDPTSVNTKLTLITDSGFPRDNPYYTFKFTVEPVDLTKTAYVFVYVRDLAGNLTKDEIVIEPMLPVATPSSLSFETRVNNEQQQEINITNSTSLQQTVTDVVVTNTNRFTITDGPMTFPLVIPPGSMVKYTIAYRPDMSSEMGDKGSVTIHSSCGMVTVALQGTGVLARIVTEDWDAGTTLPNTKICKQGGFQVTNNGTAPVTITGFTTNNPHVSLTTNINAGNPLVISGGGMSAQITELCYERPDVGTDNAKITLICDAEAGDLDCQVTASVQVSTVDPEVVRALNVRIDRSAHRVMYDDDRSARLVDVTGISVAASTAGQRYIDASRLAAGTYFLVFAEQQSIVVPVNITP